MKQKHHHISCFDLDHTLLTSTSSFRFGVYLYQRKMFSTLTMLYLAFFYWLHKIHLISMTKMQTSIFNKLFYGRPMAQVKACAQEFMDAHFDAMLYQPAVQRLQEAQRQGHYTMILSSAPNFLVELFARRFAVDAWEGTRYEWDDAQRFSAVSQVLQGSDKAASLVSAARRLGLQPKQTTAYTDSIRDLAFLNAAGTAVGVNPDRVLRKKCKECHWQILS